MTAAARSTGALAFALCLRRAALPGVLATGLAAIGALVFAPELGDPATATTPATATGALTNWLLLPLLTIAVTVAVTVIFLWPTFAHRQPGADWVRRLHRGPLAGCGAVIAGALAAQLALSLPLMTLFARGLGAPAEAAVHRALSPPDSGALLSPGRPRLAFDLPSSSAELAAIELRPLAAPPGATLEPSHVAIELGGAPLSSPPAVFDQTGQFMRLTFTPRPASRLELVLQSGNVPLFFPAGAVVAVEDAGKNGTTNGCLAALLWLVPTFVALAFSCLAGAVAARPTVLTVALTLLVLFGIAGLGPAQPVLLGVLRGHWLLASSAISASGPSLLAGALAMIGAMLLRHRNRR
ncbi:MAG: hypothetical protein NXI31_15905 [bacterium]|nr:hypothetical protein [bacterium]